MLRRADMEKLGVGSLLSVARECRPPGSSSAASRGGKAKDKPVLSCWSASHLRLAASPLKPGEGMDEMSTTCAALTGVLGAFGPSPA